MKLQKVFPLVSLLCLVGVVVSLFNLIDMAEGASSSSSSSSYSSLPSLETQATFKVGQSTATTRTMHSHTLHKSSHEDEDNGPEQPRLLFVANNQKQRKRLAALRRNATLKAKMDKGEEYTFDNGTTIVIDNQNKTNNVNKDTTPLSVDPLCPDGREKQCKSTGRGTDAQQSTLPALEFILGAAVHLIVFVIFLYWWKNVYYPVVDPYATVSPYGYDAVTQPPVSRALYDHLSSAMHTLEKSIIER